MRKNFTVSVDNEILTRFKEFCDANDINMSKRLERYMKDAVEKALADAANINSNINLNQNNSHQNGDKVE